MNLSDYKSLRDEKVKRLYKNGADFLEIRNTFGIDDDLIQKICINVIRSNRPKYTKKKRRAEEKNDAQTY